MSEFDTNIYKSLIQNVSKLLSNDSLKDLTITFKKSDAKFKVHKCLLASASPTFALLLLDHTKEFKLDEDPETFELLLKGIYLNELKASDMNIFRAYDLYEAADNYDIEDMRVASNNIMKTRCAATNVQYLMQAAKKFNLPDLEATCKETFKNLTYRSLAFYVSYDVDDDVFWELFALDELTMESEAELYMAVEAMHEMKRAKSYPKCLSQIRFLSMEIHDILLCDLLSSEEKLAVIENIDALHKNRTATIPMPSHLSSETKPRIFLKYEPMERKIYWTAVMLKCSDYKKYLAEFYNCMKIQEKEQEATESLLVKGRLRQIPNEKQIEEVVKSIFKL